MSGWTYIAQRAVTGEILDWDVPIEVESLSWELSGPGSLTGSVQPDVGGLRDADGRLLLEEWGTLIYAESGGEIRWGGILVSSSFQGESWSLECAGFSTYPHAVTYRGDFSEVGVDPSVVFRHIWAHLQSFPDSDLGVRVLGDTTPVRMGTAAIAEVVPPPLQAARLISERFRSGEQIFEDWTWQGCPAVVNENNGVLLTAWGGPTSAPVWLQHYADTHPDSKEKRPAALAIRDRLLSGQPIAEDWTWTDCPPVVGRYNDDLLADYAASQTGEGWLETYISEHETDIIPAKDAEPYQLLWWESPNCGDELDTLTTTAPFDWVERHRWDGDAIVHEVVIAYPRVGRSRDDLIFIQDDNVTDVLTIESNGDDFANTILGLGAGEGEAMLRRETAIRDGRLRRDYVYSDKAVTDVARMDALIAAELAARRAALRVTSFSVTDHVNAPIGSWQLGDDVLLRFTSPWLGEVEMRVRITGWSLTSEHTATLTVTRSDLFAYGG